MSRRGRFTVYCLVGWCAEVAFTATRGVMLRHDRSLHGETSLWMFRIYGLVQPLYEPLHDALRDRLRVPGRALVYALGFLAVESLSGRLLREMVGEAPWDYSHARLNVDGLIRLDYLPVWAAAGMGLEPLHDGLTRRTEPEAPARTPTRPVGDAPGRSLD